MNAKLKLSERYPATAVFHSLAFCQAIENLAGINVPERAKYLRIIFAEFERLANHLGDIGAIMIGYGIYSAEPMVPDCGRKFEINERLSGSRFLRGVNAIGGTAKDINKENQEKLTEELQDIIKDFSEVISIAENSSSLLNRLKDTGILTYQIAKDYGVVGVAAKAIGIEMDARANYSYAVYNKLDFKTAVGHGGDVYARFSVRIQEVYSSFEIIKKALSRLYENGQIISAPADVVLRKKSVVVSIVEGWRGDIVYFISTDSEGNINRVDVRDPSFLNWAAVGHAGPGNIVPDFPLINKSFNLSYSGNDL